MRGAAMRLARYGITVEVPSGWDARLYRRAPLPGETTSPVLHAATFPLPVQRGDFGTGAVERMSTSDVLVVLVEYDPQAAATPMFAGRRRPDPQPAHFSPRQLQRAVRGQSGVQYFFVETGRAFCLYPVLGSHAQRARLVPLVRHLLDGVRIGHREAA